MVTGFLLEMMKNVVKLDCPGSRTTLSMNMLKTINL